jgi:hypothetical protein
MAVCQNHVALVNIKIAGKWMFIPLKMVLIGIDPYPLKKKKIRLSSFGNCDYASLNDTSGFLKTLLMFEPKSRDLNR